MDPEQNNSNSNEPPILDKDHDNNDFTPEMQAEVRKRMNDFLSLILIVIFVIVVLNTLGGIR